MSAEAPRALHRADESRLQAAPQPGAGVAAAFFDLDRTLVAGSSAFAFARAAMRAGIVSRRGLAHGAWLNIRFRLRGSTDADTDLVRAGILGALAGVSLRDARRLTRHALPQLLGRLQQPVLERAYAHQDAGVRIFICTAASQEVADLLADVLGFDGALGSRSEIVDGAYTGRPDGPFIYREGKATALRELAAREGIDLGRSFAYSDSESDLPFLRAVGNPVAVNPDAGLAQAARESGWEVVHTDRLARRLAVAATAAAAAGAGVALRRR